MLLMRFKNKSCGTCFSKITDRYTLLLHSVFHTILLYYVACLSILLIYTNRHNALYYLQLHILNHSKILLELFRTSLKKFWISKNTLPKYDNVGWQCVLCTLWALTEYAHAALARPIKKYFTKKCYTFCGRPTGSVFCFCGARTNRTSPKFATMYRNTSG